MNSVASKGGILILNWKCGAGGATGKFLVDVISILSEVAAICAVHKSGTTRAVDLHSLPIPVAWPEPIKRRKVVKLASASTDRDYSRSKLTNIMSDNVL